MPDQCAITAVSPSPAAARVLEVSEEGADLLVLLFPQLAGVRVHRLEDIGSAIVISASCTASSECCPACGSVSARVHGGYSRTVADGAAGGRPVLILLRVLRFRCVNPSCPKVTFAMQSDGLTGRYCRRSVPLTRMLTGFGLGLAGRAGARLAGTLGVPVHSSTVLRLVMALPDPAVTAAPRVTGVDDFALRKGARVRHGGGRRGVGDRDRPAAGQGGGHAGGMAEGPPGCGVHLPGPRRGLCRGGP